MAIFKIPLDPTSVKRVGVTDPPHITVEITCDVPETAADAQLRAIRKALSGDGTKDVSSAEKALVEAMPSAVTAVVSALDAAKTGKG